MKLVDFVKTAQEKFQNSWKDFAQYTNRVTNDLETGKEVAEDFSILDACHFYDDVESAHIDYGHESAKEAIVRWVKWAENK